MDSNLAVLIDFENIAAGTEKEGLGRFDVDLILQRIKDKGRVLIARSYADWGRFARFKQSLLAANVTMMELTSHGMQDKNRADIAMVVDTLELAFTKPYVETFVIVSGDSDFTPMVLKLRELNKRVIGCGTRSSTSRLLIQACDEFIFYDSIAKKKATRASKSRRGSNKERPDRAKAWELLGDALSGLLRESPESPLASVVKSAMLRKVPDFSESDLGYPTFARFLEGARDGGIIELSRDSKSGGYRVDAAEDEDEDGNGGGSETRSRSRGWEDTYLPDGSDDVIAILEKNGLDPLSAPVRMTVLEALESAVVERKKRRRRVNINFVAEDIKKKLRRTHPELPLKNIKLILEGLMKAETLIHKDGSPIRSASAPFAIHKDAEELNHALVGVYVSTLKEEGADLSDSGMLADLFYGNPEQNRDVEETIAWSEAPDLNDLELDDLLTVQPTQEENVEIIDAEVEEIDEGPSLEDAVPSPVEPQPEPEPVDEAPPEAFEPIQAEPEPEPAEAAEPEAEAKPKKKTTRRRKTTKKVETDDATA